MTSKYGNSRMRWFPLDMYLNREDILSSDVSVCEFLHLITIRRTRAFPFAESHSHFTDRTWSCTTWNMTKQHHFKMPYLGESMVFISQLSLPSR
jgi:hypothetical protein